MLFCKTDKMMSSYSMAMMRIMVMDDRAWGRAARSVCETSR